MTFEEMEQVAGGVADALDRHGFRDAAYLKVLPRVGGLKDDVKPGDPLPIAFGREEDDFSLMLDVA